MPKVRISPDLETHYVVDDYTDPWREAETILMLHGNTESGVAWYGWVPHLARRFRVVRPDMRGFGASTVMPRDYPWTLDTLVDDTVGLMKVLGVERVHFVGAKLGGTVGCCLAARLGRGDVMPKVSAAAAGVLFLAVLLSAQSVFAQPEYPTRPIRFIVPFPPGGSTDPMARLAAARLSERWGQTIVVDNRPGGNTIIGTEAVAKAPRDGYTILLASSSLLTAPSLIPHLPYDVIRDFTGVATISTSRFVLVVPTSTSANDLQEFIAYVKARSGQLNYATSGIGTNTHLSAALFNLMLGTKMNHIPYKGSGTLQTDLMAGRVDLSFQVPISVISHIRAGKLKTIAISGDSRAAALPDVPTFAEAGMPKFRVGGWFGIVAPTGTPRHSIDTMSREMASILAMPDVQDYLVRQGSEAFISKPDEVTALIKAEVAKYAKIIKDAGIKME